VEFRRISNLPPYVFTIINNLKIASRRDGVDVVDLGFGNPDIPSPQVAVEKLAEAAHNPRNHRYSLSRGLPKLREAVAGMYERNFGVKLDPELQITNTIGAKEGFSHLMWVLLDRGDAAIVPSPSYPIHIFGPVFAGADLRQIPMRSQRRLTSPDDVDQEYADEFFDSLHKAYEVGWPKPRILVVSFPHNPTGATVDLPFMQRVVDFCRERNMIAIHDFAYADVGFDGYKPPSILQAEGAMDCAVELYSMTKGFSMAGPDRRDRHAERGAGLSARGVRDVSVAAQRAHRGARAHRVVDSVTARVDVRVGADSRAVPRDELGRVLLAPRQRMSRRAVSRFRIRPGRRGFRAVRAHRERTAHPPGGAQPRPRPDEARLNALDTPASSA